ncbi:MAG: hypothetical protein AAF560_34300 [Acidobacteriota bacterium]
MEICVTRAAPPAATASSNRVVVAIFDNQTGDADLDPVGRMVSELITQGLQRTGFVDVVPPATALHVARFLSQRAEPGDALDPVNALALETGAGLAVSGAYYRQGESLRFNAQITRITEGQPSRLISGVDSVVGPVNEPAGSAETLRQRVMGALASIIDPRIEQPAEAMGHLPSYEAYKAYIEGLEQFWHGDYLGAVDIFERALQADPDYQLPRLLSVFAHGNAGEWQRSEPLLEELERRRADLSPYESYRLDQLQSLQVGDFEGVYQAAARASEISPEFGPVVDLGLAALWLNRPRAAIQAFLSVDTRKVLIGWTPYWYALTAAHHMLGDHEAELADARRAREQYPDSILVMACEARAHAALGNIEAVRSLMDRLVTLLPQPHGDIGDMLRLTGLELQTHGHPEVAQEAFERALSWYENLSETQPSQVFGLAETLFSAGRLEDAEAVWKQMDAHGTYRIGQLGALGVVAASLGREAEARRLAAEIEEIEQPYVFGLLSLWQARIHANLGEPDRAVALLQQSFSEGTFRDIWFHIDPYLEPLRDEPAFQEALKPAG